MRGPPKTCLSTTSMAAVQALFKHTEMGVGTRHDILRSVRNTTVQSVIRANIATILRKDMLGLCTSSSEKQGLRGATRIIYRDARRQKMKCTNNLRDVCGILDNHIDALTKGHGVLIYLPVALHVVQFISTMNGLQLSEMSISTHRLACKLVHRLKWWASWSLGTTKTPMRMQGTRAMCFTASIVLAAHPGCAHSRRSRLLYTIQEMIHDDELLTVHRRTFHALWPQFKMVMGRSSVVCLLDYIGLMGEIVMLTESSPVQKCQLDPLRMKIEEYCSEWDSYDESKRLLAAYWATLAHVAEVAPVTVIEALLLEGHCRRLQLVRRILRTVDTPPSQTLKHALGKYYTLSLRDEPERYATQQALYEVVQCKVVPKHKWTIGDIFPTSHSALLGCVELILKRACACVDMPCEQLACFLFHFIPTMDLSDVCVGYTSDFFRSMLGVKKLHTFRSHSFTASATLALVESDPMRVAELLHHPSGAGQLLYASTLPEEELGPFVRQALSEGVNEVAALTGHCLLRRGSSLTVESVRSIMKLGLFPVFCSWAFVLLEKGGHMFMEAHEQEWVKAMLEGSPHSYSRALYVWLVGMELPAHPIMSDLGDLHGQTSTLVEDMLRPNTNLLSIIKRMRRIADLGWVDAPFLWWLFDHTLLKNTRVTLASGPTHHKSMLAGCTHGGAWCTIAVPCTSEKKALAASTCASTNFLIILHMLNEASIHTTFVDFTKCISVEEELLRQRDMHECPM